MCANIDVVITAVGAGFIPARKGYQYTAKREGINPSPTTPPLGGL